jgi:hypothetical protein
MADARRIKASVFEWLRLYTLAFTVKHGKNSAFTLDGWHFGDEFDT